MNIERGDMGRSQRHLTHFEGAPVVQPPNTANSSGSVLAAVMRRWKMVLLTFIIACALTVPAIWIFVKPTLNVTGAIRVAPILTNILSGEIDRGEISNYQNFMNTQALMITSGKVVERVADDLADKDLDFFREASMNIFEKARPGSMQTAQSADPAEVIKRAIASETITAYTSDRTELILITMNWHNAKEAQQVVDSFINAYMAVEVSSSIQGEDRKISVLEAERRVLAESMKQRRQEILEMGKEYGDTALSTRHAMKLERVARLLSELTEMEAQRIHLEAKIPILEQTQGDYEITNEEMMQIRQSYINSDPTIKVLTTNIIELEQALIIARQRLAPANPELRLKENLLATLTGKLTEREKKMTDLCDEMLSERVINSGKKELAKARAELEQTTAHEKRFHDMLSKEDGETIELGRKQLAIQELQDQLELTKETYDTIRKRIQELQMERKRPARISVAYRAETIPEADKRIKMAAAAFMGSLALAVLFGLVRDRADTSLNTPEDIVKRVGVKIIGTTMSTKDISRPMLGQQLADDYQTICANLELLNGCESMKMIAVTSPGIGEGKTTFSLNLATSFAQKGERVLLIDGDLRKPGIAQTLNIPKELRGLQDLLFGKSLSDAVYRIGSTGLDILAADNRNVSDALNLLSQKNTAICIRSISECYDKVIIDTPPVLAFADALVWAKITGAVVLTSFAKHTSTPDLREAILRIEQVGAKVLGTVLNNVQASNSYHQYSYNYGPDGQKKAEVQTRNRRKMLLLTTGKTDTGKVIA